MQGGLLSLSKEKLLMKQITRRNIQSLISNVIIRKLKVYSAETTYKPFYTALFEEKVIAQASILHSFYTSFGMSLYEQLAEIIGVEEAGYKVKRQYDLQGCINDSTELLINNFCLSHNIPNKKIEIQKIRETITPGLAQRDDEGRVDVFILKPDGEEVYIDIASGKMNLKEFRSLRKKMLRWCALRLSQNPHANVKTCIGIPFNPYHPEEYTRWTGSGCDPQEDLLIQENLWKEFSGGEDIFEELIEIFKEVGDEVLRKKITDFLTEN
jgi:hypothetical protein